jgi:hypothetical protein
LKGHCENSKAIDRALTNAGIVFLPWIGKHYERGFEDRRLLILGESHYSEWDGETHTLGIQFTRECVGEVVDRKETVVNFWKLLEQALLNQPREGGWAPTGGERLWSQLSFYNYVQSPVPGGARIRPKPEMFEASRRPFRAVLEHLRPDRVLVCGKRLWNRMEEVTQDGDYLHNDVQALPLADGTKIWCLATVHPSSGRYSWSRLHPVMTAFLDEPEKAAAMLTGS